MKFNEFLNTLPELKDIAVKISINSGETMVIKNIEWKTWSLRLLQWFLWDEQESSEKSPLENFCEFYNEWKQNPLWYHTTINFLNKYNLEWGKIEYLSI